VSIANHRDRDLETCNMAAKKMLDELLWWALALRNQRWKGSSCR